MKNLCDLEHSKISLIHIYAVSMGQKSNKVKSFSFNELKDWLFPISLEEPNVVKAIINNAKEKIYNI